MNEKFSDEGAEEIFAMLGQHAEEMSEEELNAVAAGFSFSSAWSKAKSVAKSAWHKYDISIQDTLKAFLERKEKTSA